MGYNDKPLIAIHIIALRCLDGYFLHSTKKPGIKYAPISKYALNSYMCLKPHIYGISALFHRIVHSSDSAVLKCALQYTITSI